MDINEPRQTSYTNDLTDPVRCRPPVTWDHLDVSCASGMGPLERQ